MNEHLSAALKYVTQEGWHLIPIFPWTAHGCPCPQGSNCSTPAKHPPFYGWRSEEYQVVEESDAHHVWGEAGDTWNVGIVTGESSGVFVLDVDPDKGGNDSLRRLIEDMGEFPYTREHRTGSGGKHIFFKMPPDQVITNSNRALRDAGYLGLDIRGSGGYVLAPPSMTNKGSYNVSVHAPVADAPNWFLQLLHTPRTGVPDTPVERGGLTEYDSYSPSVQEDIDTYCKAAVEKEIQRFVDEYEFGEWDNLTNEISFCLLTLANSPWNNLDAGDVVSLLEEKCNTDNDDFPLSRAGKCINSALNAVERRDLVRDLPEMIQRAIDAEAPVRKVGNNSYEKAGRRALLTSAADIQMRRVKWLWKERIALGTLSLVAGEPGMGKSTLVYWIVGQMTQGTLYGEFAGKPKDVIICATEDSWEHTIVPRLAAAGADRSRVYRVDISNADEVMSGLNLMTDQDLLGEICEDKDIGLMVLDPLISRLGDKDTHKDSEVRKALEPMCAIADRLQFSIIGLMHHNKSGSTDPLKSVMGSTGFGAVARSVHSVVHAPQDDEDYDGPEQRLFGTIKNNLGKTSGNGPHQLDTWLFHIETVTFDTEDDDPIPLSVGSICWDGDAALSVADGMSEKARIEREGKNSSKGPTKIELATAFLTNLFEKRGHAIKKTEVLEIAKQPMNGPHTEPTLDRAMRQDESLGRVRIKEEGTYYSYWGFREDVENLSGDPVD